MQQDKINTPTRRRSSYACIAAVKIHLLARESVLKSTRKPFSRRSICRIYVFSQTCNEDESFMQVFHFAHACQKHLGHLQVRIGRPIDRFFNGSRFESIDAERRTERYALTRTRTKRPRPSLSIRPAAVSRSIGIRTSTASRRWIARSAGYYLTLAGTAILLQTCSFSLTGFAVVRNEILASSDR